VQKKLTIQDIARLAGVPRVAVACVLHRNPSVAADLSEWVMRIIQEHDFVPNVTVTGLAGGRIRLFGVLTPPLIWPAVSEILRGTAEYEAQGARVPEELAQVGFADNILPAHMYPPLTTVYQLFSEMGHKAIEILLTMIDPDHELLKSSRKEGFCLI
jgi:DNA-binding LacI/PurR family transcriptional regulator